MIVIENHDPGDEDRSGSLCVSNRIIPADQTVGCAQCEMYAWGDDDALFMELHPGYWEMEPES